ncbi:DNA polymerase III subunit gamma and tau [Streptomyces sp. MI02-7b]|uniref:DNA polymerase III subunit gamma and tau n=1 Tax=Streptomyces sp. MI02-7b TaxID=462941 RepID=UPI0029ABCBEC|nr:DNA polymerase III subunit gamma and tau [Streptomyces sp. MI02-7b]MDX3076805.1 DNA polymerase III subunit gamma and tau [Streptomyces sp. MI02-7b]
MSLALYRRYRPETFAEVIGQEHVTDPLQQALRNNRVNHAYLFSGPRGCGKTTSARILARCLNCEKGPTPTPCGECRSCRDLARNGPGSIDVIEIDAASHGGVDDARDLREKAFFGPAGSRYKIYIIDEAHMVTSAGFNALLKVVEEPPEHLKFIFATTEPEKVIGTIRSRTHHYPFRLVPPGTLRDYLAEVCEREAIPVEAGVYPLVVRAGAGSVRDSMSVMDQLLAGAGEAGVTYAMATSLLGYTDAALLDDVVDAFAAGDGASAFEIVDRVIEGGHDPRRFVADLLERLRDLVILAAVPDAVEKGLIDAPADVLERMRAQAGVFGAAELSRAADLVNAGLTEMRGATSPRLQLELICARVLLPAAYDDERSVQARLDRLERRASAAGFAASAGGPAAAGPPPVVEFGEPLPPGGGRAAARAAMNPPTRPADESAAPPAPPAPAPAQAPVPPETTPAAPAAPAAPRPGAWPSAAAPGGGQRPGAWPSAASPASPASSPPAPAETAPAPAAHAPASGAPGGDPSRVRQMWPDILEAVKNRRRVTWILLEQNARLVGFDGSTLQIGFDNPGARDSFVNRGHEDVLQQAITDALGVQWRIEAIVSPGGPGGGSSGGFGGGSRPGTGHPQGPAPAAPQHSQPSQAPQQPHQAQGQQPYQQPPSAASAAPAPQAASPASGRAAAARAAVGAPSAASGAASAAAHAPIADEPPPVEYDMPEDDDPDLDETALSGHDLIVRELGATVIEEIAND